MAQEVPGLPANMAVAGTFFFQENEPQINSKAKGDQQTLVSRIINKSIILVLTIQ